MRDGTEGGVVDAAETAAAIEIRGPGEDFGIASRRGADDQLGGLAGGEEAGTASGAVLLGGVANLIHRPFDGDMGLGRGEAVEVFLAGQFDVDAEPVGEGAGFDEQFTRDAGDALEVDVAAEPVFGAELAGDRDQLLHGVFRGLDDAGTEEEALDVVAFIEVEGQVDDFVDGEAGAGRVARNAVDAVHAVEDAEVGEEDLEQRDAAAIGRVAVADAVRAVADAAVGAFAGGAGTGTGGVVFRGVGKDAEFTLDIHRVFPLDVPNERRGGERRV